ncbi:MAG: SurA N-terminal domain-containing protein [Pseudomonadales bacterium]|nr:SurA N-terminal domain-containing protein [Pseudomonadales bacterium]
MLQDIRDGAQGIVAKLFIGFIIAVFALFGVDTIVGTFINQTPATTVNGVEITEPQIAAASQRKMQDLLTSMGQDADFSTLDEGLVRELALNELIQQELIYQAAKNSGMALSSRTLDRRIVTIPDFQVDGVFSNERAQAVLLGGGYTPASFRAVMQREGVINQLLLAYSGTGFVTPADIAQIAALTNQSRDFRYLTVTLDTEAATIEISEADIQDYYDNNPETFMREEQVAIDYLLLDKNEIFQEVEISEEQIQAQYDIEKAANESRSERRASHILLEADSAEEIEEARALAQELKTRIDQGESFADLAREYSDDTASAETGGDVGYTTGDSFVEEFEQALQSLAVNEVSDPVTTEFGVHLIKLTEQEAVEFESLEQSRERISRDLGSSAVENLFVERSEQLSNLAFESPDLEIPADIMGLNIQSTELFDRSGGAGIAANEKVVEQAFSLDVLDGLNSSLISLDPSRSLVLHVKEHNPPELKDLAEVRDEIDILLRTERLRELLKTTGDNILDTLKNGGDAEPLLAERNLSWTEMAEVRRDNTQINQELLEQIFSMKKPAQDGLSVVDGFQLGNGEYVIVELTQVTAGRVENLEPAQLESLKNFIIQQSGTADFNAYLANIQSSAEIETN